MYVTNSDWTWVDPENVLISLLYLTRTAWDGEGGSGYHKWFSGRISEFDG
jgi:hypothetical protein